MLSPAVRSSSAPSRAHNGELQRKDGPENTQRFLLTGFMGSGKTTVGRALATTLGWRFVDLDDAVSEQVGLSVPEIFSQHGEAFFRKAEVQTLAHLLNSRHVVIALGGGAPETPEARALLQRSHGSSVVHLEVPLPELYRRCTQQASDPDAVSRPLMGSYESVAQRYERRLPFYHAVARHRVPAHAADVAEIARSIAALLQL